MNSRQRLNDYLEQLQQRLRAFMLARAAATIGLVVLLSILAAVWLLLPRGLPASAVWSVRGGLLLIVAALGYFGLWLPWNKLQHHPAAEFERRLPEQQGRIATYLELKQREAAGEHSLFTELLADDALQRTERTPLNSVAPKKRLQFAIGLAAIVGVALLGLLVLRTPWSYGARHVLLGATVPESVLPVKGIVVKPGDVTVRRNADLVVRAQLKGFSSDAADIFVRFEGEAEGAAWERAAMQRQDDGSFEFALFALRAPAQYYIASSAVESAPHAIKVVDVPRIERVHLRYEYPSWTGLPNKTADELQDVRAVADTRVVVEVQTDKPLEAPVLIVNDARSALHAKEHIHSGAITVAKPGQYHLAARVAGEWVALTDNYLIEVADDAAPTIQIAKPGRDWRASAIEEVPVRVRAEDDYRVQSVELRYAVNGGTWKNVKLPAGEMRSESQTLLRLEELGGKEGLTPGDLVTYYAVARDRDQVAQSDLFMVQVQPFDRRFTEEQGGGGAGAGGGGNEQQQIAERQREILLATFNLQRSDAAKRRTPEQLRDNATMLAEMQATLADQTRTLLERTQARSRGEADPRVKHFVENLQLAAKAMDPAAEHLQKFALTQAIPGEQQALQYLMRAESAFREIQVSRQSSAGSASSRSSRDLSELYELEMDLSKTQYETEAQLDNPSADRPAQERDDTIEKLRELAQRQEQLAQQARQQQTPTQQERWQQEQLRREAEELRRRLQEMAAQAQSQAQNGQRSQQSGQQSGQPSGQQSGQQSGQSQSNQPQSGQPSAAEINAALDAVNKALGDMRKAENAQRNSGGDQEAAEQASRNLRQALNRIGESKADGPLSDKVKQFADRAQRMAKEQRRVEEELQAAQSERGPLSATEGRRGIERAQAQSMIESKQKVLNELRAVERELRETIQSQRSKAPQTTKKLGEAVTNLDESSAASRLERSMIEIERSRARQIGIGEGIITESLENFAGDLQEAAALADQEARKQADNATPNSLLSELAELRRAVQAAQQAAGEQSSRQSQPGQSGQPGQQANSQSSQQSAQPGQQAAQSGQPSGQSGAQPGSQAGGQRSNAGGSDRGNSDTGVYTGGINGGREPLRQSAPRNTAFNQQLQALTSRLNNGNLTRSDIEALRAVTHQIRRSADNPLANEDTRALVERLELAALNAVDKAKVRGATRSATPAAEDSRYRESVAEYYRRLGK